MLETIEMQMEEPATEATWAKCCVPAIVQSSLHFATFEHFLGFLVLQGKRCKEPRSMQLLSKL
jgi:hypothetical protein